MLYTCTTFLHGVWWENVSVSSACMQYKSGCRLWSNTGSEYFTIKLVSTCLIAVPHFPHLHTKIESLFSSLKHNDKQPADHNPNLLFGHVSVLSCQYQLSGLSMETHSIYTCKNTRVLESDIVSTLWLTHTQAAVWIICSDELMDDQSSQRRSLWNPGSAGQVMVDMDHSASWNFNQMLAKV